MKKYKNYIIAAGILLVGIILGSVFTGNTTSTHLKDGDHEYIQNPVTKLWTCAMHPQIRMTAPGNCPICGMKLIPLDQSASSSDKIGPNEIVMSAETMALANIQTSVVTKANATKEIHLLGRVQPDERNLYAQVSHIPGRIERLYVNFTGEKVVKGQRIVRIYSPELISAQKELFEAIKSKDIYPALYKASRNKLKLWKLSDAQIDAIEKSGKVQEQIDILSDYTGYVMKRDVDLGNHLMEGSKLFDIANLSKVWVLFEAYESDLPWIHINDEVNFKVQGIPSKNFKGKVTYVDPFVEPDTRITKVRVELNNPKTELLPEMFANGIISSKLKNSNDVLIVPKSAVLWTGKRSVVYVKVPHKNTISFEYREIELGPDMGDFYIVNSGLKEGEVIATNGVFKIDASAQLVGQKSMMNPTGEKGAGGGMNMPGMDMSDGEKKNEPKMSDEEMKNMKTPSTSDKSNQSSMLNTNSNINRDKKNSDTSIFKNQFGDVIKAYIVLKDDLVKDDNTDTQKAATKILQAISKVDIKLLVNNEEQMHWMKLNKEILTATNSILKTSDINQQRSHFKNLSNQLITAVKLYGVNQTVFEQHCPMADNNNGAYWLSFDKTIKNPYFGKKMSTCGNIITTFNK